MKTTFKFNRSIASFFFALIMVAVSGLTANAGILDNQQINDMGGCPSANFEIVNNGVDAGIPVLFQNRSNGGSSYLWDFGDGQTSTDANPVHTYAAPGTYQVKLIVIGDGCTVEFIGTEDVIMG